MASTAPPGGPHSNIFVRGLPLGWTEADITTVFQQYGALTSIRLVRHSVTKHSLGYGFVRFQQYEDAQSAISALDGTTVQNQTLQVKFADADAGPPTASAVSGLTPSESVYVKHLPAASTPADVQALFESAGAVQDVKLFPCLDAFRGASALVRMASRDDSERAIAKLNNSTPPGGVQSLVVRFAESAAEKAARLTRRNPAALAVAAAAVARGLPPPAHLRGALAALGASGALHSRSGMLMDPAALFRGVGGPLGAPNGPAGVPTSIGITGLPPTADRLWVYENFAVFGAVLGVHVLEDTSGQCSGTGLVTFGESGAAERAALAMNDRGLKATAEEIIDQAVTNIEDAAQGLIDMFQPALESAPVPPPSPDAPADLSSLRDAFSGRKLMTKKDIDFTPEIEKFKEHAHETFDELKSSLTGGRKLRTFVDHFAPEIEKAKEQAHKFAEEIKDHAGRKLSTLSYKYKDLAEFDHAPEIEKAKKDFSSWGTSAQEAAEKWYKLQNGRKLSSVIDDHKFDDVHKFHYDDLDEFFVPKVEELKKSKDEAVAALKKALKDPFGKHDRRLLSALDDYDFESKKKFHYDELVVPKIEELKEAKKDALESFKKTLKDPFGKQDRKLMSVIGDYDFSPKDSYHYDDLDDFFIPKVEHLKKSKEEAVAALKKALKFGKKDRRLQSLEEYDAISTDPATYHKEVESLLAPKVEELKKSKEEAVAALKETLGH